MATRHGTAAVLRTRRCRALLFVNAVAPSLLAKEEMIRSRAPLCSLTPSLISPTPSPLALVSPPGPKTPPSSHRCCRRSSHRRAPPSAAKGLPRRPLHPRLRNRTGSLRIELDTSIPFFSGRGHASKLAVGTGHLSPPFSCTRAPLAVFFSWTSPFLLRSSEPP